MIRDPKSLNCDYTIPGSSMRGFLDMCGVNGSGSVVEDIVDVENLELDVHVGMKKNALQSHIEVCILDSNGSKYIPKRQVIKSQVHYIIPFNEKIVQEKSLLPNDSLTLLFVFNITTDILTQRLDQLPVLPMGNTLREDMEMILDNPDYADATITVGHRKFFILKAIVAARSSVFAAMFDNDMKELEEGNVDVTDMTEEVVEDVLRFIYTDRISRPDCEIIDLLYAAQKYDLKGLVMLMAQALVQDLTADNAAERLVIADRFELKDVKQTIIHFIEVHIKAVMQTDGYNKMAADYPYLALEIFETMALE
ncbi:protein roadkill-like [Fopius arisanus]|uniref:Protein roadkill-like n=1 Tax=Fopius arisanus TaxID=64838 RepID=A0A9R1T1J2_9HYME|nr:PREDICTED: protein roadkill-like [Fopius arisanus]